MKTVKNLTDQELSLPNIGVVKAGETIEVPDDFHNGNFEDVKTEKPVAPKKEVKVKESDEE